MLDRKAYDYEYDSSDPYVYPGTHVLINKLGLNALHPFREGNDRPQRIFANQLARQAGWSLNLKSADPRHLCDAYIVSMTDSEDLIDLLGEIVPPSGDTQFS